MSYKPKRTLAKLLKISTAWRKGAPDKRFGGFLFAEYEAKVERSLAARRQLAKIKMMEKEAIAEREAADADAMSAVAWIVAGVIGDPLEGPDGVLYAAMGYIRQSLYKTGLTRKKKSVTN